MQQEIADKLVKLKKDDNLYVVTVGQIINKDFGPEAWTVDKLVPEQSITGITGAPGSYKTWLTLEIAKCISQGSDFLGKFKTSQGAVLFLDKENHLRHIKKRLNLLSVQDSPIFYFSRPEDFFIDRDKDYKSLIKAIKEFNIKVVVFDSLVRIHSGDENNSKDIAKAMNAFRKITNQGVTVIIIHHNRKEGVKVQSTTNSIRGSSDILASLDCLLQVSKTPQESFIGINQTKLRQDEAIQPFKIEICLNKEKGSMSFAHGGPFDSNESDTQEAKESILEILKDRTIKTKSELATILSENYSNLVINRALKELESSEMLAKTVGAHNAHSFSLKSTVGA